LCLSLSILLYSLVAHYKSCPLLNWHNVNLVTAWEPWKGDYVCSKGPTGGDNE
jgi:hypothetical protein